MARPIRFSPAAVRDLALIRAWYGQTGSGTTARRKVRQILAGIQSLGVWPEQGRLLEDAPDLRALTVQQHMIVYRLSESDGCVYILRLWAPGQNRQPLT